MNRAASLAPFASTRRLHRCPLSLLGPPPGTVPGLRGPAYSCPRFLWLEGRGGDRACQGHAVHLGRKGAPKSTEPWKTRTALGAALTAVLVCVFELFCTVELLP